MRGLWYGDRRDRVKWGGLIHLAKSCEIPRILQIAYLRDSGKLELKIGDTEEILTLQEEVWKHFSELRGICRLGEAVGVDIRVMDDLFEPTKRSEYVANAVAKLKATPCPVIVFLDPDTGIAPTERANPEHVAWKDLQEIWAALHYGSILAVYQHADRTGGWIESRRNLFCRLVKATALAIIGKEIAGDVALLWCRKALPLAQGESEAT